METLNLFFSKIKELSFWQRVFSWSSIKALSYEAYQEFKDFEKRFTSDKENSDSLKSQLSVLKSQIDGYTLRIQEYEKENSEQEHRQEILETKLDNLNFELKDKSDKIAKFEAQEEDRNKTYQQNIAQLNQVKNSMELERQKLHNDRLQEKEDEYELRKKTWVSHETDIQQSIKMICRNHIIEYVEKVPFKGSPDNTIKICDEFIIFDAKSPSNNDLNNFPNYILEQTKNVKKYANQQNVRKDIFLVIPSNTVQEIPKFSYNMADYNVFIITKDSLEPIILSLKKIEEYEFAEQLSPEDRDNVCRVIGKFSHSTKRRIQIDQFFIDLNLDLLKKCKVDIPHEMLKQISDIEQAEVINPPTDKRGKHLLTHDFETRQNLLKGEISSYANSYEMLEDGGGEL